MRREREHRKKYEKETERWRIFMNNTCTCLFSIEGGQ